MLKVTNLSGFGAGAVSGPGEASASFVSENSSTSSLSQYTFAAQDLGDGGTLLIAVVGHSATGGLNSMTVDGNTATEQSGLNGAEANCYIMTVDVGSATSGDVVINVNSWFRCGIQIVKLINGNMTKESDDPTDKSFAASLNPVSAGSLVFHTAYDQNGGMTGHNDLGNYRKLTYAGTAMAIAWSTYATAPGLPLNISFSGTSHPSGSGNAAASFPAL